MTAIAAYETPTEFWIASDSMAIFDDILKTKTGSKLLSKGNYIIGFAQSYRIADIIKETKGFPEKMNSIRDLAKFRNHLLETLKEDGYQIYGDDPSIDLIIISPAGMYTLEYEYQIHKVKDGYHACGGGAEVAMGVLYLAKARKIKDGRSVVISAIKAAVKHSACCGGKYYVKSVKKKK